MPNTFKSISAISSTSLTTLYTCPSSNTNGTVSASVVILCQAANLTSRADILTVLWVDSSNSNLATSLVNQVPVPAQQSIGCLTGKLVLQPGDILKAQSGVNSSCALSISVLETS